MSVSTSTDPVLLRIRDLTVRGHRSPTASPLLDRIDLDVREREIIGVVGESGAGKSTLGLAALGYAREGCRFTSGTVSFRGEDLLGAPRKYRRSLRSSEIAYVAQSAAANFNPFYRLISQVVEFQVQRGLASRQQARQNAIALFRELHLPDPKTFGSRFPHQVSGGQLQRAMTAMAMICEPRLIVFDEPTTALDVTTQVEVLISIREAVRRLGTACIYITHDLAVVSQMADRIVVLKDGKAVEEQATRSLIANPREEYTKSLWAVRTFRAPENPPIEQGGEAVCSVRGLSAGYRKEPVIQDITFDLGAGRTLAVVGESGSGKSTLARCISGLLAPTQGEIRFEGQTLAASCRDRVRATLRDIQIVFQASDITLNPRHRVQEIIGRPLEFYHGLKGQERRRGIANLLEMVELDAGYFGRRYPGELSGGQRQRIGIARALAARPKLIICDEIISALDQLVGEGILRLLSRLQREGRLSYLFITHDIAAVRAIADEVIVMKDGRIVGRGPKALVLDNPTDAYTRKLMEAVPAMDPDWLDGVERGRLDIDKGR